MSVRSIRDLREERVYRSRQASGGRSQLAGQNQESPACARPEGLEDAVVPTVADRRPLGNRLAFLAPVVAVLAGSFLAERETVHEQKVFL